MPRPIPRIEDVIWGLLLNCDLPEQPSVDFDRAGCIMGFHKLSDDQFERIRKVLDDCKIGSDHIREGGSSEGARRF